MTVKPEGIQTVTEPTNEQRYLDEAERLAKLPPDDRKAVIAVHRAVASNRKVPAADRKDARDRADALEWHLRRLARKKTK